MVKGKLFCRLEFIIFKARGFNNFSVQLNRIGQILGFESCSYAKHISTNRIPHKNNIDIAIIQSSCCWKIVAG